MCSFFLCCHFCVVVVVVVVVVVAVVWAFKDISTLFCFVLFSRAHGLRMSVCAPWPSLKLDEKRKKEERCVFARRLFSPSRQTELSNGGTRQQAVPFFFFLSFFSSSLHDVLWPMYVAQLQASDARGEEEEEKKKKKNIYISMYVVNFQASISNSCLSLLGCNCHCFFFLSS